MSTRASSPAIHVPMKKDRLDYCAATWDPRHTGTLVWSGTVDVGLVQYHP